MSEYRWVDAPGDIAGIPPSTPATRALYIVFVQEMGRKGWEVVLVPHNAHKWLFRKRNEPQAEKAEESESGMSHVQASQKTGSEGEASGA